MFENKLSLKNYLTGAKPLQKKNLKTTTFIAMLIVPFSGLITDMYIPSMPHMATDLHQSATAIQLTLSLFLISYGLAQFVTGSLIDSFGRYRLSNISLVLFILSNFVIVATQNIQMICAMRIVQGITTGFIVVAARAYFVDVFEGEERKHYLSLISIVWSIAPIVAPFIGGYLQQYLNWQANFYVLAIYGIIMLVLQLIFMGETAPAFRPLKFAAVVSDYKVMFSDRRFVYGILICGLSYGTTMVFGLSGSFIIEHQMHYSPVVAGYAALIMGLAWMCGGLLGKATIHKPFFQKLKLSNGAQVFFTVCMIGSVFVLHNLYTLVLFAFLIHVCVGFIFNNYFAFCLGRFPQMAGVVSGLSGGANFIITAMTSYIAVGIINPTSQALLGAAYLVMALLIFFILQFLLKTKER